MSKSLHHDTLFSSPDNPAPRGIVAGNFQSADKLRLRHALCPSALERTRGTVILLQGRNEAIEKYFETIGDLSARGYMVAAFDWRGQGGSERSLRNTANGHVGSFQDYADDLNTFLEAVVLPEGRGPYAIMAHSLGGLVALLAAPTLVTPIERIVLSAPLIGLPKRRIGTRGMLAATTLLRMIGLSTTGIRAAPKAGRMQSLADNPLTSDLRRHKRNVALVEAAPHLFVGNPTASWVRAALLAMRHIERSDVVATMQIPTLFVTAPGDRVVATPSAERLAWRMRSGHHLSLPGARHELLQEADRYRDPFLAAFDSFVGGALPLEMRKSAS